jgi:hypothetical protein
LWWWQPRGRHAGAQLRGAAKLIVGGRTARCERNGRREAACAIAPVAHLQLQLAERRVAARCARLQRDGCSEASCGLLDSACLVQSQRHVLPCRLTLRIEIYCARVSGGGLGVAALCCERRTEVEVGLCRLPVVCLHQQPAQRAFCILQASAIESLTRSAIGRDCVS